jgi:UDP-MurNAc hydroxylase
MTTTIDFISQACVVINADGFRIATDPWLDRPACVMATVPWPPFNSLEREKAYRAIDQCTHIYISHDHEDHFDPVFLRRLAPKILIVGKFSNAKFLSAISALEPYHSVRWMDDGEEAELDSGVVAKMYLEKPLYRVNSILSLRTKDCLIINGNDCGMELDMLNSLSRWRRESEAMVFLYTLNLLASGWFFPYCREDDNTLVSRYLKVKDDVIKNWHRLINALQPTLSACYAGPLVMVDKVNSYINNLPYARDNRDLIDEINLSGDVFWPAPFSSVEFVHQKVVARTLTDWERYISRPLTPTNFKVDTYYESEISNDALLQSAAKFHNELLEIQQALLLNIAPKLIFAISSSFDDIEKDISRRLLIDPRPGSSPPRMLNNTEVVPVPWFKVTSTPVMVNELFCNTISWDSFYGGRARLSRRPDTFDQALHLILHFGRDSMGLEILRLWLEQKKLNLSRSEIMERQVNGRSLRMLRFCPHEGEDLRDATIVDNCLVCPRHRWEFDLSTGRCKRGDKSTSIYLNNC